MHPLIAALQVKNITEEKEERTRVLSNDLWDINSMTDNDTAVKIQFM